jgi:hypothetical protein
MNARLDNAMNEARTALSATDQDRLADLIAAYVGNHANPPVFADEERAEIRRRNDELFDPAPQHEVREFFARHRG